MSLSETKANLKKVLREFVTELIGVRNLARNGRREDGED
jgi:hypothetical protein